MKRTVIAISLALALAAPAAAGTSRHLTIRKTSAGVRGAIHAAAPCYADQLVKVQRKTSSGWKTVAKTRTNDEGRYRKAVTLRSGKRYRTLAPRNVVGSTTCLRTVSDGTVTG
ncbi:MAG TPA: hypothetical protein VM573_05520 [Actinomycetota bacterium]|jgi:hypothetical protein|nr:hypothetical protein [Actinomycetota bacterium]